MIQSSDEGYYDPSEQDVDNTDAPTNVRRSTNCAMCNDTGEGKTPDTVCPYCRPKSRYSHMRGPIVVAMFCLLTSCGPGRWVGGNAKHFQQRNDAKNKSNVQTIIPAGSKGVANMAL